MSYLCRKGLNISGVAYKPGDVIPDGVILPNRVRTLTAVGMISEVAENTETPVEVQEVFSLLQMTANEGITAIGKIESDNVLILIHATDTRKTMQNAAKERADILSSAESDKNAPNGNSEATGGSESDNQTE